MLKNDIGVCAPTYFWEQFFKRHISDRKKLWPIQGQGSGCTAGSGNPALDESLV